MAHAVEDHRVHVHPAPPRRDKLEPDGPPVGFHGVAEQTQRVHRRSLVLSVYGEVQVSVRACLLSDQRVDPPTASDPEVAARTPQVCQDRHHLAQPHTRVERLLGDHVYMVSRGI